MGKRICTLCVLALVAMATTAWAASTANPRTINVSATVPVKSLTLTSTILKFTDGNPDNNPWTQSSEVQDMAFGTLTSVLADGTTGAGCFYSNSGFCVVLFVSAYGIPYQLTSTCTGLTGSGGSIAAGGFGCIPVYSSTDLWVSTDPNSKQGTMPSTALLGSAGTAIASGKIIYKSEPSAATDRILQVYYGIAPKKADGSAPWTGWTGVPLTQAAGTYTGQVQITLANRT